MTRKQWFDAIQECRAIMADARRRNDFADKMAARIALETLMRMGPPREKGIAT